MYMLVRVNYNEPENAAQCNKAPSLPVAEAYSGVERVC